ADTGNPNFQTRFLGYKVYKLASWKNRSSVMPPQEDWALLDAYGYDTQDSKRLIGAITDTTMDYDHVWYERPHYPVGRYAVVDSQVFNGFDYAYVVASAIEVQTTFIGKPIFHRYESPIIATIDQ